MDAFELPKDNQHLFTAKSVASPHRCME